MHPFIMELFHRHNIVPRQLIPSSWWTIISCMSIWLIANNEDMIRMDELFVRDLDEKRPSKKRFGYLLGHLSFWVSGMKLPLIFLYTKKKRKEKVLITKYMTE